MEIASGWRVGARPDELGVIGIMFSLTRFVRRRVAVVTAISLLVAQNAPLVMARDQAKPVASAQTPIDGGWPRSYTTGSGASMVIYQPQVSTWASQKLMTAYAAVSYTPLGAAKPALGTLQLEADTTVSVTERLVDFSKYRVVEANFPSLPKEQLKTVVAEVTTSVPPTDRVIGLDRVLAAVDKSLIIPKNVEGVKSDPPPIFFSQTPAILVNIDGDPIWSPIKDNDLKFAVNTNWDLFQHEPTKTYYVRNDTSWLQAADVKGPWQAASKLPESFKKLPADENWKEVKAHVPGKKGKPTTVFVSTVPAELILLTGQPNYVLVQGTSDLLWVSNTESDVFRMGKTGPVYFLVAGRWFSSPGFDGPWTFATPNLPEAFKQIPVEHDRSRVLAAVPGTDQAVEAVLLATIPQTARVNKKELKAPDVAYQGDPKFEPIPSTTVARAVNTDKDIIKVGDLYYLCFQGVWFVSKAPTGPWDVAESIPASIYEIPASSPAHNVTYVTVVEDDDDDWVTFAAVAGFTGVMIAWGCAVWGTGYYYPPYYGYGGFYPYYYPHYPSYGYGAYYNPWTGAYGRSAVAYGPYGGAGMGARYNPRTGTYARGAVAWGPYGARGAAEAYNPRTGTYARTQQGAGVYGSWGTTSVQRGDDWARTSRVTNNVTGTTTRVSQGSGGGESITRNQAGVGGRTTVGRTESGDVYAGHDGNVYKKEGDSWQKYEDGGWSSVEQPTPTQRDQAQANAQNRAGQTAGTSQTSARTGQTAGTTQATARTGQATGASPTVSQLNRDSAARREGAARTGAYSGVRSGTSRPTSYRPSGGASRGGGGRRR
jgi:hypothetical protein